MHLTELSIDGVKFLVTIRDLEAFVLLPSEKLSRDKLLCNKTAVAMIVEDEAARQLGRVVFFEAVSIVLGGLGGLGS